MRKPVHWGVLFALAMLSYGTSLLFEPGSKQYFTWLMPSKAIGFFFLIWAAKNKISTDWKAFSAKRLRKEKHERAKMKE
jgi:hypothetical protein